MAFKNEDAAYEFFMQNFIKISILEFIGFVASSVIALKFYGGISYGLPLPYVTGILFSLATFTTTVYCIGLRRGWWHKS